MSHRLLIDEDDPLAGAPDEVLAAFIALGGMAARKREERQATPGKAAGQFADAAKRAAVTQPRTPLLNRKA
ncbi:MAG: hypothetical protein JO000_02100 [Alphaproteobacteria bacterium]|nr:hypothetical protein [Alphaproteobacteria bacterium]